jgi:hypothetical protein
MPHDDPEVEERDRCDSLREESASAAGDPVERASP